VFLKIQIFVVAGEEAGSKLAKAQKLEMTCFLRMKRPTNLKALEGEENE